MLPKKNFLSWELRREKPAEKRTQVPEMYTSKKIIQLFRDDPSFSGIQGRLESAVPVGVLDTPSLGFTAQEISGAEAGEHNVSVPTEIALPPTCLAQFQVPIIIVDGNSSQQAPHYPAPSKIADLLCQKRMQQVKKGRGSAWKIKSMKCN